jgi:hypothetical protein
VDVAVGVAKAMLVAGAGTVVPIGIGERLRPPRQQQVAMCVTVWMAVDAAAVPVPGNGRGITQVRNRSQGIIPRHGLVDLRVKKD